MRFLIVDDHALVRRGIVASLRQREDWLVVAAVGTLHDGLGTIRETEIDVAIIDLGLPDGSGLEFIERALELSPDLKIVVSSMRDELVFAPRCIAQGAMGTSRSKIPTKFSQSRLSVRSKARLTSAKRFLSPVAKVSSIVLTQRLETSLRGSNPFRNSRTANCRFSN